ncbi:hypothetical protein QUF61_11180 [Candidatus Venteria ishoeyi]|uniref:hypothetical protein n=1 Tax=Candidatus Venteria ishoeyi TaxID=1899563 RepID=UPI0025A68D95|nr:hypothetical protein [Candidatus Venteria ishoeyi]MDM8547046.1 hypothetical protein [Candidatus Venteria ishoeyi]
MECILYCLASALLGLVLGYYAKGKQGIVSKLLKLIVFLLLALGVGALIFTFIWIVYGTELEVVMDDGSMKERSNQAVAFLEYVIKELLDLFQKIKDALG